MLLNIPDSAKVVAFKPEHPGLWTIKVGAVGRGCGGPGCTELRHRRVLGSRGLERGRWCGPSDSSKGSERRRSVPFRIRKRNCGGLG